ncbi:hypothetical protein [Clostridium sp.]|jgi:NADH:ubiquinone oxidoreductase subunit H|uniref:hypothetical protein n=1 Tax=Clostridium sp. TaxID=1506 RepID=UPI003EEF630F
MTKLLFFILICILFLVGTVILQIFLSKKENKWLGLILPIISFLFSIVILLITPVMGDLSVVERIVQFLVLLFVSNISTIILLVIYFACREKFKKKKEIDKMNIQDL